jgi:hypothetical protein
MFKYLFRALLNDDSFIEQNHEDKGSVEGRNCFYDVLQAQEKGNLKAFAVYDSAGNEWLIDIGGDCHFEHNLILSETEAKYSSFKLHGEKILTNKRLIWFIRRELVLDVVNTTVQSNEITSYNFGFQATDNQGKNHEFIISLS